MFTEIKSVIVEALNVEESEVTLESSLKDDLGIDSLDAVELIMELEDVFEIKIEESVAQSFVTIKDIVGFIETNKG